MRSGESLERERFFFSRLYRLPLREGLPSTSQERYIKNFVHPNKICGCVLPIVFVLLFLIVAAAAVRALFTLASYQRLLTRLLLTLALSKREW